jgi:hypothetical protein
MEMKTIPPLFNLTSEHEVSVPRASRSSYFDIGQLDVDVVANLTATTKPQALVVAARKRVKSVRPIGVEAFTGEMGTGMGRSFGYPGLSPITPGFAVPQSAHAIASRRFSLQFTPTSPTFSNWSDFTGG